MTGNPSLDKFLEFFNSNSSSVISTAVNQDITFATKKFSDFKFSDIEINVKIPCILLNLNFAGIADFSMHLIISKTATAALADLMLLGDGNVEYSEEQNESLQEMFNQVLGSLKTELDSEGIHASGTVQEVQLSDMEIHKEFMNDNKMVEITFKLFNKDNFIYLIFDLTALKVIENLFGAISNANNQNNYAYSPSQNKNEGPSVSAQRVSFAEIEEVRPLNAKNINIDLLMDIPLPVTVELGRKEMRIKEILGLGQGSVVELSKLAGDLVDLMINGKKFAVGEVMVVDENYAVRIVNLISREERIRHLGPE
jgi:flagellar motor switch protein FliN/FliY